MLIVARVFANDVERRAHRMRHRQPLRRAGEMLKQPQQPRVGWAELVQQTRDADMLDILVAHMERARDCHRAGGDAKAVAAHLPLTRLEMECENLEHRYIGLGELEHALIPLLAQSAHHVAGQHEKTRPGQQRKNWLEGESGLRGETRRRLEKGHERGHENGGIHAAAAPEVEAGDNDRQVIEIEKGDPVVDVTMNQYERRDEQQNKYALEIIEDELASALECRVMKHCRRVKFTVEPTSHDGGSFSTLYLQRREEPTPSNNSPMKSYDRAYFQRWYHNPTHRVATTASLGRKVRLAVGVAEFLLGRPIASVLDVGCGEAAWFPVLRRMRPRLRYIGLDTSEYVLERYGDQRRIRQGALGELSQLRLPSRFDLIVCADVAQYVATDELSRGLTAIRRLLVGVAYIEAFATEDAMEGDRVGWRERSAAEYRRLFRRAGLVQCGPHCYVDPDKLENLNVFEVAGAPTR